MPFQVLLPVDTNEEYARRAAEVVTNLPGDDVAVEIVNVYEEFEVSGDEGAPIESEDLYDETDFPDSAEAAQSVLEERGISVNKRRVHGEPTDQIIKIANEIGADSIVMAGRRRSPLGKVLFGSVTQGVLLSSEVPVTVVPTE